ncbi:MAG TPA: TlpA disulfide reductase family protein, partial [Fimbriimonadaceae bacterium]|nr:TlpA disulfide reductase family protein [Fimbriimonadaceae bacterium]
MRHFRFALAGLAMTALATAAFAGELGVGMKAPPITVAKWVKGKPVKLGDGMVHVVEFWATWCGPCKTSIPHLTELQKKLKGKVNFTGVSIWEDPKATDNAHIEKVEDFVAEWGKKMDYTVAADGFEGSMAKEWMEAAEGQGIPTAFIIGK